MKYYGVIGNRDYIKRHGEKRPFWEYLDHQPDGWLSSLVYKRLDLPESKNPMIWDCGAWSYKNEDTPRIGKSELTPASALNLYEHLAEQGSIVIAPDHMLLTDCDHDKRRLINRHNAAKFLRPARKAGFTPMATVHGLDIDERVRAAKHLYQLGYTHLAIGGVAAYASRKTYAIDVVAAIRDELPDIYIHVLGLSSPPYVAKWHELGVDSCDGSSHFKQAFTGGTFFAVEPNGKLKKHQAARPGEEISAPICSCKACLMLREENIDTRSYGSNENNMGRAAHNLNMLMLAQQIAIHGQTVLVSCVAGKEDYATEARNLYKTPWFIKARRYAEEHSKNWYVLSAQYGLVHNESIIEPYDKRLTRNDVEWAKKVANKLHKQINGSAVTILAGKDYRAYLVPELRRLGHKVYIPMEGLGIGQQLAFMDAHANRQGELL